MVTDAKKKVQAGDFKFFFFGTGAERTRLFFFCWGKRKNRISAGFSHHHTLGLDQWPPFGEMPLLCTIFVLFAALGAQGAVVTQEWREATDYSNVVVSPSDAAWGPITASCAAAASCALPALFLSDALVSSRFGFVFPSGAKILAINVSLDVRASVAPTRSDRGIQLYEIALVHPDLGVGAVSGWNFNFTASLWNTSWITRLFPLPQHSVLWGGEDWLTPANVSRIEFGLYIRLAHLDIQAATGLVKCARVGVTYEYEPASSTAVAAAAATSSSSSSLPSSSSSSTAAAAATGETAGMPSSGGPTEAPRTSPAQDTATATGSKKISELLIVIVGVGYTVLILSAAGLMKLAMRRKAKRRGVHLPVRSSDLAASGESFSVSTNGTELSLAESDDTTPIGRSVKNLEFYDVQIEHVIGAGHYGSVFSGTWQGNDVACKKLHSGSSGDDIIKELRILNDFKHPNIVHVYGLFIEREAEGAPKYIVMERVNGGALDAFLRSESQHQMLTDRNLVLLCVNVAAGMKYVAAHGIIHRDLSARNLLVHEDAQYGKLVVKISDFGLGYELGNDQDYCRVSDVFKAVPVRHSPPEVIMEGRFSEESDVWSFGIVIWEVFSFGEVPYDNLDVANTDDTNAIATWVCDSGYRLPRPERCPELAFAIAQRCWHAQADKRPKFAALYPNLSSLHESMYSDELDLTPGLAHMMRQSDERTPDSFYCDLEQFKDDDAA